MLVCSMLLVPLYVILQILIPVITQVIKSVCSWVTTVIQVVTQVLSQVCKALPWPLSLLCNWVTTLVTTLQSVVNWVCNTVLQAVLSFVTWLVAVLIYVVHVVCIVINIIIGVPALILCLLRLSPVKRLRVCLKILTDANGQSAVTPAAIAQNLARIGSSYKECGIEVIFLGTEHIVAPQYLTTTGSSFWGIFSAWHVWFTQRACWCCNQVTVFVVDSILPSTSTGGVTYWGDSWCRVDSDCNTDDTVMAHEIGHLLNLWHVNDPNNVMYPSTSPTSHDFTPFQCCLAKRSPFVTYV